MHLFNYNRQISFARFISLLFVIISQTSVTWGIAINNGVVGEPTIACGTDIINFWVKTRNPFYGKVYVKGEYGRPECTNSFGTGAQVDRPPQTQRPGYGSSPSNGYGNSATSGYRHEQCPPCPTCAGGSAQVDGGGGMTQTAEMAHISVKLGTCSVQRDRSLTPAGVRVTFTVVVSFHENFVTKVDRAYQIQCAYMETDRTVTSEIDVSMPVTQEITQAAQMPTCEYTIRRDSPDGPQIRFAKVGDKVYHRWQCFTQMPEMFGMLINNCFVDDGAGQRVQVVDEVGCSVDQFVLPDLSYERGELLSYAEAHVFKFADRAVLDFQCAISICIRDDGGCNGPPRCGRRSRQRRAIVAETVNRTLPPPTIGQLDANEWRLSAQRMTVVDIDDDIHSNELAAMEKTLNSEAEAYIRLDLNTDEGRRNYYRRIMQRMGPRVCLSVVGFGLLVALCTFIFTLAAVVVGTVYVIRRSRASTSLEKKTTNSEMRVQQLRDNYHSQFGRR